MRKNKHWTQAEKDYVCDVWGEVPLKRIAKNIGKTPKRETNLEVLSTMIVI